MTKLHKLSEYKSTEYNIKKIELSFNINSKLVEVSSKLYITNNNMSSNDLILDGEELDTLCVHLDSKELNNNVDYKIENNHLTIFAKNITSSNFILETKVLINPYNNKQYLGLYSSSDILCTQCEPHGFRRITWFIDRPDNMAMWQVDIIANKEKYPVMLSNGNLVNTWDVDDNTHGMRFIDPFPKPSYLFALVAGDLAKTHDTFKYDNGRTINLAIYIEHGKEQYSSFAMESLHKSLQWDFDNFNLEYDLDEFNIVAVSDFNFGAMENKGLNIFNDAYILVDHSIARDIDYFNVEAVIAHEYFHNYTGNRVTCRDWFQLTLKEGLTVLRDQMFSTSFHNSILVNDSRISHINNVQFLEDISPLAHPVRLQEYIDVNNFYSSTVYMKGAEICRQFLMVMGHDEFCMAVNEYLKKFDSQAITCEDFVYFMSNRAGIDSEQFLHWYEQVGIPQLCISRRQEEDKALITVHQKDIKYISNESKALLIPLKLYTRDNSNDDWRVLISNHKNNIHMVNSQDFTITVDNTSKNTEFALAYEDTAHLLITYNMQQNLDLNTSVFSAIENRSYPLLRLIYTHYLQDLINDNLDSIVSLIKDSFSNIYSFQYERILTMLTLDNNLVLEMHKANANNNFLLADVNNAKDKLLQIFINTFYQETLDFIIKISQHRDNDIKYIGLRKLRSTLLLYLVSYSNKDSALIIEILQNLYSTGNITDKVGVLTALNNSTNEDYINLRSKLFNDYYQSYSNISNTINYALSIEASINSALVFDRINSLISKEYFNINNPNQVRALLGKFTSNYAYFHTQEGYDLMYKLIIDIDKKNSSLSSSLSKYFYIAKTVGAKELAIKILEKMLNTPKISTSLQEIVNKQYQFLQK